MKSQGWRRALWIASGMLGILILGAVVAFPSWIRSVEERRWAAMGRQIDDLEAQLRSRKPARVLLRGTPVPGNAWEDYGPLLESLAGWKDSDKVSGFGEGRSVADQAQIQALVAPFAAVPEVLRRAARKAESRPPAEPPKNSRRHHNFDKVLGLALAQARLLQEAGQIREAEELILDVAQFNLDQMSDGSLGFFIGVSWFRSILLAVARIEESLPPDSLRELSRILGLLDGSIPSYGDSLLAGAVETGREIQAAGSVERLLDRYGVVDRDYSLFWYANSERLVMVDYFDSGLLWDEETISTLDKSWLEARNLQTRLSRRMSRTHNPVGRIMLKIQKSLNQSEGFKPYDPAREHRARVRLLRAAAEYRLTGEVPSLDDPFGTKIRWSKVGGDLTLWSVGRDGVDQGGLGGWESKAGQDIVLRLPGKK